MLASCLLGTLSVFREIIARYRKICKQWEILKTEF